MAGTHSDDRTSAAEPSSDPPAQGVAPQVATDPGTDAPAQGTDAPAQGTDAPAQGVLPQVDMTPSAEARRAGESEGGESKGGERGADAPPPEAGVRDDVYRVELDVFEGPLDLLLHLIRKHEIDILDIPVSFITGKYLEYLKLMRSIQIDVASEYLVMAATLTHVKSRMLLPPDPDAEADDDSDLEIVDPRADLVRRLLEYQKYKHVAAKLAGRATLGRDFFPRGDHEPADEQPTTLAPVNVFKLFDAFEQVLKRADQTADHRVMFERVGIAERVVELIELLQERRRMRFSDLFLSGPDGSPIEPTRLELVVSFLALLEMCKMRIVKVVQEQPLEELTVEFSAKRLDGDALPPPASDLDADSDRDEDIDETT